MGRTPCCSKMGLNRGPWTPEEDDLLVKYIQKHGEGGWRTLPKKAGLLRCGKSCRLRWMNYLRPDVKRGQILPDEEDLILRLHRLLGNRWSLIAGRMPGRTDNEIKNYWNTHLSKKLISEGIDPRTHKPLAESELEQLRSDKSQGVDNVNSEDTNNPTSDSQKIQLEETETAMSDNIESCKVVDNIGHSPELSKNVNDHPDTSAIDSLHTVANSSSTAIATQSTYIGSEGTYSSAVSDLGKGSGKLPSTVHSFPKHFHLVCRPKTNMEIQSLLRVMDTAPIWHPAVTNGSFAGEYVRKIGLISCSKHIPCQQIQSTVVERRTFSFPLPRPVSCKATSTKDMSVATAKDDVLRALSQIVDPDFGTDIVSCGFVKDLVADETSGEVSFRLDLTTPACPIKDLFEQQANEMVSAIPWVRQVNVTMSAQPAKPVSMEGMPSGLKAVSNIIAVSSCKGGVGKSTVAVNLAYALAGMGARVGIFDADVYGPSLPTMVSPENRLLEMVPETRSIIPTEYLGVKLVSYGFSGQGRAIMRGPMVSGVINQLLTTTEWGELDYLLIDMPPGTGDIQLTLCQIVPLTAAVIVTTPQKLSFIDVAKGVRMFSKLKVPCIAVVENMCHFDADGKRYYPFGKGSGSQVVQQFGIPYLFELPIRPDLSASGDSGSPEVVNKPQGELAKTFSDIGACVVQQCAKLRQQVSTAVTYDKELKSIRVKVPSSDEEFLLHPATVRRHDRSAQSIDEWTGEQKLQYTDVPENIEPESIRPMGNYAVSITWSDGFDQVAPYDQLQLIERLVDIPKRIPEEVETFAIDNASQNQMQGIPSTVESRTTADAILEHAKALKGMK